MAIPDEIQMNRSLLNTSCASKNHRSLSEGCNDDCASVDALIGRRNRLWSSGETFILIIEYLLLIFPMYSRWSPTLKKREKSGSCVALIVFCVIPLIAVLGIWISWLEINAMTASHTQIEGDQLPTLMPFMFGIGIIGSCVARLVSMYYFYFHFRWPWYCGLDLGSFPNGFVQRSFGTSVLIARVIFWLTYAVCFFMDITTHLADAPIALQLWIVFMVLHYLLVQWPLDLHLCALCLVYLKYHHLLKRLTKSIQNGSCSFVSALEQYRNLHHNYVQKDCSSLIKGVARSYLGLAFCSLWMSTYDLIHSSHQYTSSGLVLSLIGRSLLFVLYFYFASVLSETFMEFGSVLMKQTNIARHDYAEYNHLVNFTSAHSLTVHLTKRDILKSIFMFLGSQIVAYAARYLV